MANKNKNYVSGRNFEYNFLKKLEESGKSVKSGRFYASQGPTDVWWVDKSAFHNEAQLKYSRKKPYISPHEMTSLRKFAESVSPFIKVWIVKKQYRKPIEMELVA